MKILVTGGSGFIGSALIRHLILERRFQVLNLDNLTYAAHPKALATVEKSSLYQFEKGDIKDPTLLRRLLNDFEPDAVMHLAAESHVDRSITGADEFVMTNIVGTFQLIKECRRAFEDRILPQTFRFLHVSTDEVYGSLNMDDPSFTEESPYLPNSPYSASKASSDHLVRSFFKTHHFPALITHCSNNYGPYQNEEKLIPLMVSHCYEEKNLPVYGTGKNIRDWVHVDDHISALMAVLEKGKLGEVYNIGGGYEVDNLTMVKKICQAADKLRPRLGGGKHEGLITFVTDRKGHDLRYSISNEKITRELGWKPAVDFEKGLFETVEFFIEDKQ